MSSECYIQNKEWKQLPRATAAVYVCRGEGETQLLYKYCFNILNNLWCEEFSNLSEWEEKSNRLTEPKTDSFQRPNLNIGILGTLENYFWGNFFF